MGSGRRPEAPRAVFTDLTHLCRPEPCWSSQASSRRGDAREDALRPCLTYRTLLPTTVADTDATCSRCLTLRGEGTRRVRRPFLRYLRWRSLLRRSYAFNAWTSRGTSAIRKLYPCAKYSFPAARCNHERSLALASTCTSIIVQALPAGCGAALAATLPEPYRTLEVQSWRAGLVFVGVGLRPNSRKN